MNTQVTPVAEVFEPERRYFAPDALQAAAEYGEKCNEVVPSSKIEANFDFNKGPPEGYGLLFYPFSKRAEKGSDAGNVLQTLYIIAVPSFETLAEHEKGDQAIRDAVVDFLARRVRDVVVAKFRAKTEGGDVALPLSIEDFIERRARGEGLKAFTDIVKPWIAELRKRGLTGITPQILRWCLQSATYAKQTYSKLPQQTWTTVMGLMRQYAVKNGHDPKIYDDWIATRDQAGTPFDINELDTDALASMFGGSDAEAEHEEELTE